MANPLFSQFGANPNLRGFMAEVERLKRTLNGNPKQIVEQMLQTGQLSQAKFNEYSQMANEIMSMMK